MNLSVTTHACSQQQFSAIMRRGSSVALVAFLLTIALTACIGPVKPVPTQQSQEASPPPTETADASKPVEPAPSNTPPTPPTTLPVPLPPIGMGQPTAPQGQEEIPVVEAKPVLVVASRESYNVQNATTATKTDTPIMETPVSIQVVPQQVLKDQQTVRIDKAVQNVSGLYQATGTGALQSYFTLRGFQSFDYYRDGVRVNNGGFTPFRQTANLEQIEVLKGPASILYGRIEPGGLTNLVTKQPLASPYYALGQQFGSFDFYRTTIDATGPLTKDDTLLYRVNLAYENLGSFIDFIDNQRTFVAPVLRWNLSPQTQANFYLEYQHSRDGLNYGIPVLGNRPAPVLRGLSLQEPGAYQNTDEVRVGFNWSHAFNEQWTLRHRFDTDLLDFPETATVLPLDIQDPQNCTRSQCTVNRLTQDLPNQKRQDYYTILDLTGKFDTFGLQHTLLLGGDFWHEHWQQRLRTFTAPSIDLFNPVHTGAPNLSPADLLYDSNGSSNEEWYGVFLQDQVKLPYGLHLLAGFRHDNASSSFDYLDTVSNVRMASGLREHATKPRFGVLWQPIPELSLYGSYVENFGLSNGRSVDSALPPTTAQQWEVGLKTAFFGGRVTGTLAWFDLTKQNIATPDPDPARAAAGFSVVTGEARNRGIELDIAGELWPGVKAIAVYAYIDSKITKDRGLDFVNLDVNGNPAITPGNTGNRFFGVPRNGGSFWLTYEPQAHAARGLKIGAGVVARSQQEGDNANTFQLPGYALVNLMAGYSWKVGPSTMSLQLNVDNLLNAVYFDPQGGGPYAQFGTPRTFVGLIRMELW